MRQLGDFLERLRHDQRIEAEGIFVDAAVFERQRGRLAVGDHHDLLHVFFLAREDALRQTQSFARVRVVRADLHARQLAERHFFGASRETAPGAASRRDIACGSDARARAPRAWPA